MALGGLMDPKMLMALSGIGRGLQQAGGEQPQGSLMQDMLMYQMLQQRQQEAEQQRAMDAGQPLLAQANMAAEPALGQMEKDRFGIEIAPGGQAPYQMPQQPPAPGMPTPFGGQMDQNMMQMIMRMIGMGQ